LLLIPLVLLPLGVELPRPRDNLFLLGGEVLISVSLLPFLLQETNGLEWALALNNIGSYFVKIVFTDLLLAVFLERLIDSIE